MNEEAQITQLIARRIAGVGSEGEVYEWQKFTENDPEIEHALKVIVNLWNAPGMRNKKEVEAAFRKVSFRLNERRTNATYSNHQQRRNGLFTWWSRT